MVRVLAYKACEGLPFGGLVDLLGSVEGRVKPQVELGADQAGIRVQDKGNITVMHRGGSQVYSQFGPVFPFVVYVMGGPEGLM